MANFEVLETYNSEIEKLEPTTPGHADVFNAIFQQLINNDAFIKKVAEQQLTIIQSHLNNENEPHQKVFDTYYRQLVNYTDKAIADLINGAPETADTLRELADLIDKNKDVTTALNEAIGKKANQTELDQAISDINTLNSGLEKHSHTWDSITGKPSAFPPSSSDLLNKIYPVGSIYMSINNVSPQTFIGGTWEQIKNRWLVGAGDEYAVGTYGGNAVHSHTQRMIFTANYAGNNGLMYTAGGTTPTDVIYTGETRSVPPYYAVYMWKRIA